MMRVIKFQKIIKKIFLFSLSLIGLYIIIGFFLKIPIKTQIGKISIKPNAYFVIYHIEEFREFDDLKFDFYRNDSLIIKQKYFDSTDDDPLFTDFKLHSYNGLYYLTYFDSTKIKIICDEKLKIIYPVNYEKDDSLLLKQSNIKKMLHDKKLTLGRW